MFPFRTFTRHCHSFPLLSLEATETNQNAIALNLDIFFVTRYGCTHCGPDTWQEGVRGYRIQRHLLYTITAYIGKKEREGRGRKVFFKKQEIAHFLQNIANYLLVKNNKC